MPHEAPSPPPEAPRRPGTGGLRRHAPLVPVDSTASRALVAVIGILTFLAALCAGSADLVAASSAAWRSAVARELTIQVRPSPQRDTEAAVARAAELARTTPGIAAASPFSRAESERLLEPWLGAGLDLGDLPVPRLIAVRMAEGARPDLAELRRRLQAEVPGATLDDHALWLARLSTMANTVVALGIGLVLLVLVATALAVAFATRGAMAGNREVVEVLHVVGADDAFIAREFQGRFLRLGLRGGAVGGGAALALLAALGWLAASWRASPAGDQMEALFGGFDIGARGYLVVIAIALGIALLTGVISRLTVRRFLQGAL